DVAIEVARQSKMMRPAAHIRQSGLCRLLHHIAELAGRGEFALAVEDLHLSLKDAASNFGPCEPVDQTHLVLLMDQRIAALRHTEKVGEIRRRDHFLVLRPALYYAPRDFAANVADLALQVANSRFTRVAANNFGDRLIDESNVLFCKPCILALFAD